MLLPCDPVGEAPGLAEPLHRHSWPSGETPGVTHGALALACHTGHRSRGIVRRGYDKPDFK